MARTRDFRKTSYQFQKSDELKELPRQFSVRVLWQNWRKRWRITTYYTIAFLVIFITTWVILYSNLFKISSVKIDGFNPFYQQKIQTISNKLISNKIFFIIPRNNYFTFPKKQLQSKVKQEVFLSNLQIHTSHHVLIITGTVNATALAAVSEGNIYMVDETGRVITQIQPKELQSDIPLVQFKPDVHLIVGESAITNTTSEFILSFGDQLKKISNVEINNYLYDTVTKNVVQAQTTSGWSIILDTSRDASAQTIQLQELLTQSVSDQSKLNYIDLRVAGRAFIKEK